MAANGVLEQPASLGGVAGAHQQLRQLELGVRSVSGDVSEVADGVEGGLPVAAGNRLLDDLASLLGALVGRGAGQCQGRE